MSLVGLFKASYLIEATATRYGYSLVRSVRGAKVDVKDGREMVAHHVGLTSSKHGVSPVSDLYY
jgi:hypothetical protein